MAPQRMKIRKIGNSRGLILPAHILQSLHLLDGEDVDVSVEDGVIIIARPPPSLDQLVESVPEGEKFNEAKTVKAVGLED